MADQIGLENIYKAAMSYRDRFGGYWKPAPLLEQYSREGRVFAEWKAST